MKYPLTDAETAFRQLAEVLSSSASKDFFRQLVTWLGSILQADHVLIARIEADARHAHSVALWSKGQIQESISYALEGTPCDRVMNEGLCHFPQGLQKQFPEDDLMLKMGAEAYMGIPMIGPDAAPLGYVAVMWNRPIEVPELGGELLSIAASQAASELARRQAAGEVNESQRRLHTLMDHLPGMAYQCRNDARWTPEFVSGGAEALTGYSVDDFLTKRTVDLADLYYARDLPQVAREVEHCVARRKPFAITYRMVRADRSIRWVWERGQAVEDDEGRVLRLEGFITDITEQHQSARVQRVVLQIARAVTAHSGKDFFDQLVRHLTQALEVDAAFIATLQGEATDTLRMKAIVVDGRSRKGYQFSTQGHVVQNVLEQGTWVVRDEAEALLPAVGSDHDRAAGYVGWRLDDSEGKPLGVVAILSRDPLPDADLALSVLQIFGAGAAGELQRQATDRRMRDLAFRDAVTRLPNRVSFMQKLDDWSESGTKPGAGLACILFDLRRFMEINDTRGFDVGDEILRAIASLCRQQLDRGDFVARLGGDEFVMLLRDVDQNSVQQAVQGIQRALSDPIELPGGTVTLETNIGASHYPGDADQPRTLFRHASIALHNAKRDQASYSVFTPHMAEDMFRRQAVHDRFTQALHSNALQLHFQPKFDLASGALTGAEALCRWYDPEWGWVSPGEFIPLAEERGTVKELGEWVLDAASQQLLAWDQAGLAFSGQMAINVSARQLEDPYLVRSICEITERVKPHRIGLELTESGFMRDPDQAVRITHALKQAGFWLSIDDFGTGYSSLSYLRRFSADTLKIDMSFVRDMLSNNHDRAIVETIIAMARTLGMDTVAEGVETADHANALLNMGCDQAQGYYYGRPVSAEEFAQLWLKRGNG